ncbi:MAG: hypothetical protein ABIR32_04030 [Ilumatobacteraceae bacterium]
MAATASDDRKAIIEFLRNLAAAGDDAFDEECVVGLIAQLSDEDASLVADIARAGGQGDPQLSPEGEALGDQLATCAIDTATTTGLHRRSLIGRSFRAEHLPARGQTIG